MILITIALLLGFYKDEHCFDEEMINGSFVCGIVELAFELIFLGAYLL